MDEKEYVFECDILDVRACYGLDEFESSDNKWINGQRFAKSSPILRSIEQLEIWDGRIFIKKKIGNERFFLDFEDIDSFLGTIDLFQVKKMNKIDYKCEVGSGGVQFVRQSVRTVNLTFYEDVQNPLLSITRLPIDELRRFMEKFLRHMDQEFICAIPITPDENRNP